MRRLAQSPVEVRMRLGAGYSRRRRRWTSWECLNPSFDGKFGAVHGHDVAASFSL
jgi:hypothetical protein